MAPAPASLLATGPVLGYRSASRFSQTAHEKPETQAAAWPERALVHGTYEAGRPTSKVCLRSTFVNGESARHRWSPEALLNVLPSPDVRHVARASAARPRQAPRTSARPARGGPPLFAVDLVEEATRRVLGGLRSSWVLALFGGRPRAHVVGLTRKLGPLSLLRSRIWGCVLRVQSAMRTGMYRYARMCREAWGGIQSGRRREIVRGHVPRSRAPPSQRLLRGS